MVAKGAIANKGSQRPEPQRLQRRGDRGKMPHHHARRVTVSAYVIVEIEITDPELYERYKQLAPPTVQAYGGRYLARGGATAALEGVWDPQRLVILEFESLEQARAWHDSPEYREARSLRWRAAQSRMLAIAGV